MLGGYPDESNIPIAEMDPDVVGSTKGLDHAADVAINSKASDSGTNQAKSASSAVTNEAIAGENLAIGGCGKHGKHVEKEINPILDHLVAAIKCLNEIVLRSGERDSCDTAEISKLREENTQLEAEAEALVEKFCHRKPAETFPVAVRPVAGSLAEESAIEDSKALYRKGAICYSTSASRTTFGVCHFVTLRNEFNKDGYIRIRYFSELGPFMGWACAHIVQLKAVEIEVQKVLMSAARRTITAACPNRISVRTQSQCRKQSLSLSLSVQQAPAPILVPAPATPLVETKNLEAT
jgi:hypothetical protein